MRHEIKYQKLLLRSLNLTKIPRHNLCWFDYHHVPRKAYTKLNLWTVECILTNIPFICFSYKRFINVVLQLCYTFYYYSFGLSAYDKSSTLPSTMSIMIETFGLLCRFLVFLVPFAVDTIIFVPS
jgi:hypothetical protein